MAFEVRSYVEQFDILSDDLPCPQKRQVRSSASAMILPDVLYAHILEKFRKSIESDQLEAFTTYQDRMFDLVENLRELDVDTIAAVLDYTSAINPCLPDIIIMMWCIPRTMSKLIYARQYKQNIRDFNWKITQLHEHKIVYNFCIETISKTNNVPVHCIDYIWPYMIHFSIDLLFYHADNGNYIGLKINETDVELGLCVDYLLELGLGGDLADPDSLRNLLRTIVTNTDLATLPASMHTYKKSVENIRAAPDRYFGTVAQHNLPL